MSEETRADHINQADWLLRFVHQRRYSLQCGDHGCVFVNQVLGEPRSTSSYHGTEQEMLWGHLHAFLQMWPPAVRNIVSKELHRNLGSAGSNEGVGLVQLNEKKGYGSPC